jgi:hypothetical protein
MTELEHTEDENCWCEPELYYVDPETDSKVWVHKDTTAEGMN